MRNISASSGRLLIVRDTACLQLPGKREITSAPQAFHPNIKVVKVIELLSEPPKSWEDAAQGAGQRQSHQLSDQLEVTFDLETERGKSRR